MLLVTIVKYLSYHKKHRYELIDELKKQPNRIAIHKKLVTKIIMICRTTAAHMLRTRVGFIQYDVILNMKQ